MSATSTSIGDLVSAGALQFGDGYRTRRSEHGRPGFRIIRVADVFDNEVHFDGPDFVSHTQASAIGSKVGKTGDILLTTKGTVGRVAVLPPTEEAVVYSPQLCYFRVLDHARVEPRFLRYWFSSQEFWDQASYRMNNTDMAAYLNMADIRSLKISLPLPSVQQGITEVLGAIDDKIAVNCRLARASESLALAMLQNEPATVMLNEIVAHKRQTIDPSRLDYPQIAHFSLPAFDTDKLPNLCNPGEIKSNKFLVQKPSVLISKLNPRFPRVWDLTETPDLPVVASTEFLVLEPNYSSPAVLWAILGQKKFSLDLQAKVAGTSGSHQRVKPADLLATQVIDPRAIDDEIQRIISNLGAVAFQTRSENRKLVATRDRLLPQLMSGKLRVKDAEALVESVV